MFDRTCKNYVPYSGKTLICRFAETLLHCSVSLTFPYFVVFVKIYLLFFNFFLMRTKDIFVLFSIAVNFYLAIVEVREPFSENLPAPLLSSRGINTTRGTVCLHMMICCELILLFGH